MREDVGKQPRLESPWRLIQDGSADGAWNMAVDEAIATAVGDGLAPATLRFYGWSAPTVSLGYLQKTPGGVDLTACRGRGIPVVRRVTGGRAVLHAAELTYSVVVPLQGSGGILPVPTVFTAFCQGLIAGLARLGVEAAVSPAEPRTARNRDVGACFLLRGMPAVLVGGRKLLGSAQRRWDRSLLQHGSLLLDFDPHLHQAIFPAWSRTDPLAGVTSLRVLLGRLPTPAELVSALVEGWSDVCGGPCIPGELTPEERRLAGEVAQVRYRCAEWTFRR